MTYRRKKTHNRIDSMKELVRVILSDRMNPKGRTMCQKKKQTKTTWAGPAYRKGIFLVAWLCSCVGVRSLCCLISSYIINTTCCHHIWSSTHTHTELLMCLMRSYVQFRGKWRKCGRNGRVKIRCEHREWRINLLLKAQVANVSLVDLDDAVVLLEETFGFGLASLLQAFNQQTLSPAGDGARGQTWTQTNSNESVKCLGWFFMVLGTYCFVKQS